ncbi:uncharacterized protein LOC143187875 [Calliopsis andreniformis]|uniref:uncharacterized protein LOC143187875 n=1 Tax=Calliopsis andreniformis TaxID=337506 RepID=UPI003FCE7208
MSKSNNSSRDSLTSTPMDAEPTNGIYAMLQSLKHTIKELKTQNEKLVPFTLAQPKKKTRQTDARLVAVEKPGHRSTQPNTPATINDESNAIRPAPGHRPSNQGPIASSGTGARPRIIERNQIKHQTQPEIRRLHHTQNGQVQLKTRRRNSNPS